MGLPTTIKWTLRMPADLYEQMHEQYAQTYPQHRQSFNTWLVARLRVGLTTNSLKKE